MNYYTDKEIIYVDSHNRASGTNSNFTYTVDLNPNIDFDHVVVLDASIPKSNYVISASNLMTVTEENIDRQISVPTGNYNRSSLRNVLLELLNAGTHEYTMSFPNGSRTGDNGKYVWTCSTGINPTFTFTNSLHEQLGFDKGESYTFVDDSLTSVNISNFRPEAVYYILSNVCQNHNNSVLANIISSTTNDFSYVNYQCQAPKEYSKDFAKTKSNTYSFIITDEDFVEVNFNGLNVVLTLMFYRKNHIDDMLKSYMKAMLLKS
jgi:hypothetical protein